MRLIPVSLWLLLALAVTAAVAPADAPATSGFTPFRTPSRNIYCAREHLGRTDFLRCDVQKLAHKAPRPKGCQFGFGTSFGVNARGRAHALCVSDSVFDAKARVLPYGTARRFGPFSCASRTSDLRCTNLSGHGFSLNRTRYRLF